MEVTQPIKKDKVQQLIWRNNKLTFGYFLHKFNFQICCVQYLQAEYSCDGVSLLGQKDHDEAYEAAFL